MPAVEPQPAVHTLPTANTTIKRNNETILFMPSFIPLAAAAAAESTSARARAARGSAVAFAARAVFLQPHAAARLVGESGPLSLDETSAEIPADGLEEVGVESRSVRRYVWKVGR